MHVVPVSTFLDLNLAEYGGQIPAHQVLKEKGLLVVYDPLVHEGEVAFISHQWTAWNAADPGFDQLGVLKRFIERILAGDIKKGTGNPCLFLFFFSRILYIHSPKNK